MTASEPAHNAQPRGTPRVLIADDDPAMRTVLVESLRADGYEVLEAANGRELFWSIELAGGANAVDLVVADVRMPGYSGLDVAEAWVELKGPRVILMTAFSDPEVRRRAMSLGIVLLDKPFEIDQLLRLIHELVRKGSARSRAGDGGGR